MSRKWLSWPIVVVAISVALWSIVYVSKRRELSAQELKLSKYSPPAPPASVPPRTADDLCPALPKHSLYSLVVTEPEGEKCAETADGMLVSGRVEDYGTVTYPLRGWVGCDGRHPLEGVSVASYSKDGKLRFASTTTNKSGRFLFRELKEGSYRIVITAAGLSRSEVVVRSSKTSESVPCIFANGNGDK